MNSKTLTLTFEEHRPQLKSFLLRITTSPQDCEDIIQDTYIKAHKAIETFRKESSLKTWLFQIATNLAKDFLRSQKRWPENVTDICRDAALGNREFFAESMDIHQSSPQIQFEIKEHIVFCFTCISKSLPLEQQLVILLKEVHGFKVKEISVIMEQSEAMIKYYLHTGRQKMIDVFDNRCSLINKGGVCHQCTELNGVYNPKQEAQNEIAKIEMAKAANKEDKQELFDLRMKLLQEIDPFESPNSKLQLHHLQHNKGVMDEYLKKS